MFAADSTDAAVDSELALLSWNQTDKRGWVPNTLNPRIAAQVSPNAPPLIMTSRIDGPTKADALRIMTDSVAVEKPGLTGTFYIDAGGKAPSYDAAPANSSEQVPQGDTRRCRWCWTTAPAVFAAGTCPDAALYVGWYSLRKYVPAFTWVQGRRGLAHRQLRGRAPARPRQQRMVPQDDPERRGRHARGGERAVPGRLSAAGGVLPAAADGQVHGGRVLLADATRWRAGA